MDKNKYKEKLREIMQSEYVGEYEIIGDFAIALSLCLINQMDVYVYGGGTDSYSFIRFLEKQSIQVKRVLDQNKSGQMICGKEVIHPSELKNYVTCKENTFVFIHTSYFKGMEQMDIMKHLQEAEITQFYALTKIDRYIVTSNTTYWVDANREEYYQANLAALCNTLDILADEKSCEIMNEYIRTYIQKDVFRLKQQASRYKYFCEYNDEKKEIESIYSHLEDEVYLNCGANEGDNIFYYFANGLQAKKIIAVEGDNKILSTLRRNLERLPQKCKEIVSVKNTFLEANTDFDELLEGETLTLLNADIEGGELELLKAMKNIILKDRPVISICIYHKKEDIIEIPQYIDKEFKGYKLFIRKYAAHYGNENRNKELVLYAVPEERLLLET